MSKNIAQRIKHLYPNLSRNQKMIASFILRDYKKAHEYTLKVFAREADVSESSVNRFIAKMGYAKYSDMQNAIQELAMMDMQTDNRMVVIKEKIPSGDILKYVLESDMKKISALKEKISRTLFNNVIEAILIAKRIFVIGTKSTEPLAHILSRNLTTLGFNTTMIDFGTDEHTFECISTIIRNDLLIAISLTETQDQILNAMRFAKRKNADVIAITNTIGSPLSEYADYHLVTEVQIDMFTDSMVATLSLINAIIVQLTRIKEKELRSNFNSKQKLWQEYIVRPKKDNNY